MIRYILQGYKGNLQTHIDIIQDNEAYRNAIKPKNYIQFIIDIDQGEHSQKYLFIKMSSKHSHSHISVNIKAPLRSILPQDPSVILIEGYFHKLNLIHQSLQRYCISGVEEVQQEPEQQQQLLQLVREPTK